MANQEMIDLIKFRIFDLTEDWSPNPWFIFVDKQPTAIGNIP